MAITLQMLRSGSSGNAALVTAGRTRFLIDAGIGPRVLAKELGLLGLGVRDLTGVLYTHCHSDHLRGNTLTLLAREGVPAYLNAGTWEAARRREQRADLERLTGGLLQIFEAGTPFELGGLEVSACPIDHGQVGPANPAGDPVCFTVTDGTDTLGYATDVGRVTPALRAHLLPADLLVFESNHDVEMTRLSPRPYMVKQWIMSDHGHLSNVQAADALAEMFHNREGGAVILAHLSDMGNTIGLARETAVEALRGRCDVQVGIATRLHATAPWVLDRGRAKALRADPLFDELPLPAGWPGWGKSAR